MNNLIVNFCKHHFEWNGSPFMPMSWFYMKKKNFPHLEISNIGYFITFDEWECKCCGLKRQIVNGCFSDIEKTPFRFIRDNKFIQPMEIENKNIEFLQAKADILRIKDRG
jgi:hypothetical protein